MKKALFFIMIFGMLFILSGCGNSDKGLIENETISFIDKYTREEYKGIEVEKTYSYISSTGRTKRLVFIKNTTNSNLYMYVTSQMLDDSGNSVETDNERIDVIGPNGSYIITEDYYNNYNDFNTVVEVSDSSWESCLKCVSVEENVMDDGDVYVTYKNTDANIVKGEIKLIAYKGGKIVDFSIIKLDDLGAGESGTDDGYLTKHDKYEVYVYAYK